MRELSEARKADRKVMAQQVFDIARALGADAVIKPEDPASIYNKRRTVVAITAARGLCVSVGFRGDTPQERHDIYVLSWHVDSGLDTCLHPRAFAHDAVNRHHFHKATDVAESFTELKAILEVRLKHAASGYAFDDAREAAVIAKNGGETAARRNARWRALPVERLPRPADHVALAEDA